MRSSTFILLSLMALAAQGKVTPMSLIGDNMVLKQNSQPRLSGTAAPGSDITVDVSWNDTSYSAKTDDSGSWTVRIDTPQGSFEPQTITISDGEPLTINNVRIGEVWLASGQSNMQMPLKGFGGCCTQGGFDEIAGSGAYADKVSFYMVSLTQSYTPVEHLDSKWDIPSPETSPEFSALAWHYAKRMSDVLGVPVGIVNAAYGGARVESWTPRDILETYADVSLDPADIEPMTHYLRPLLMYNAMFYPVKDYGYSGIIWYQGCSNVGAHDTYADRLAKMITRWRKDIGEGDIPFYAVEIAPYEYDVNNPDVAPLLRKAQWDAMALVPNADMISTNDLIEPFERFNIHPSRKAEAGKRLCDLALHKTYGKTQFPAQSPRYKGHRVEDGAVWIALETGPDGICRNYDIQGFEVAGADKVFHPADSVWLHWQTNEIVASSKEVPEPVAVRYCWKDFQSGTLYSGNYLPLIPFRSDDW
ncbi:MAG: sialate O-acetylesterase [Muribaculaceae bacterium]|nr:sialate O-acetylesterase [Muribaculaceae bacterium]